MNLRRIAAAFMARNIARPGEQLKGLLGLRSPAQLLYQRPDLSPAESASQQECREPALARRRRQGGELAGPTLRQTARLLPRIDPLLVDGLRHRRLGALALHALGEQVSDDARRSAPAAQPRRRIGAGE